MKSDKLWERDTERSSQYDLFDDTQSEVLNTKTKNVSIPNTRGNRNEFGTVNTCAIMVIVICMLFWTLVFLLTAIATRSPTMIIATVAGSLSYWALTWFIYWLGWKYYWIMLALGWLLATTYMLTIITALTEAFMKIL